jgi:hypothetical protein
MDFFSYLNNIRQKPEYVRKQIALWTSGAITLTVFIFWISLITISPLVGSQTAQVQEAQKRPLTVQNVFEQLKAGVGAIIDKFQ